MSDRDPVRSALFSQGPAGAPLCALTRRALVATAASTMAALPRLASAQSTPETGQPVATPGSDLRIDVDELARVSLALVGGGSLNDAGLQTLAGLLSVEDADVRAFRELASVDDPSAEGALDDMSADARDLVENILQFWYLGQFGGNPVENRADLYFSLPVWSTVPWFTQPTLCKAFGYWSAEVSLDQ
jgi:hypothetical protein